MVWFIEAVHERRGLPEALLRALRDRWAASLQLHLRARSVEIAALLAGIDEAYTTALLDDPSPKVRTAVAGFLGAATGQDGPVAERLLQARLEVEQHRQVRAEVHLALGSLVGG